MLSVLDFGRVLAEVATKQFAPFSETPKHGSISLKTAMSNASKKRVLCRVQVSIHYGLINISIHRLSFGRTWIVSTCKPGTQKIPLPFA